MTDGGSSWVLRILTLLLLEDWNLSRNLLSHAVKNHHREVVAARAGPGSVNFIHCRRLRIIFIGPKPIFTITVKQAAQNSRFQPSQKAPPAPDASRVPPKKPQIFCRWVLDVGRAVFAQQNRYILFFRAININTLDGGSRYDAYDRSGVDTYVEYQLVSVPEAWWVASKMWKL